MSMRQENEIQLEMFLESVIGVKGDPNGWTCSCNKPTFS